MSRSVPEGVSISVPKGMSRLVPERMSRLVPEGMSRSVPEGMSRSVPEGMCRSVPKGVSRLVPEGMSRSVPEGMSRLVPKGVITDGFTLIMLSTLRHYDKENKQVRSVLMDSKVHIKMEMEIPSSSKVKFITTCSLSINKCKDMMKAQVHDTQDFRYSDN
ncbi:hypothetical protein Tco_0333165 [Tanacetum coccineum]